MELSQHYFQVTNWLKQTMSESRKSSAPQRYNKVNQQRKFHLLSLFYSHRIPLRQAAKQAGINYLTAKTILFFHKKDHKSYQFDLRPPSSSHLPTPSRAAFISIRKNTSLSTFEQNYPPQVNLCCSVGNIPLPFSQLNERNIFRQLNRETHLDHRNQKIYQCKVEESGQWKTEDFMETRKRSSRDEDFCERNEALQKIYEQGSGAAQSTLSPKMQWRSKQGQFE